MKLVKARLNTATETDISYVLLIACVNATVSGPALTILMGASGDAVGRGTAPRDWRFRVRLPVGSLEIFEWPILLSAFNIPRVHSASNRNEYQRISWGG
jgi:hypothetical protein